MLRASQTVFSFLKKVCTYLFCFLTALGLYCCEQAFSNSGEWGYSLVAVGRLLLAVASLIAQHGL